MKTVCRIITVILILTFISGGLWAKEKKGKLDSFEEKVSEPQKTGEGKPATGYATQGIMETFATFFLMGLVSSGASMSESFHELKAADSPALPTVRIEPNYQYVFNGVHGISGNVELGYLMFGVDANYIYYWEKAARDNIHMVSGHLLLRTLFLRLMQANLALGVRYFDGNNSHTGFDLGFPVYFFFTKHFIWDIKPYITFLKGRDIYEISSGLSYKYKMFGVRAAYRAISVTGETLHGPQIGAFFQW